MAAIPILLIRCRLQQLILPYLLGFSLIYWASTLREIIEKSTTKDVDYTAYFQPILYWNGISTLLIVCLAAAIVAILALLIIKHSPRYLRIATSTVFRSVCVYLIVFGGDLAHAIVNHAEPAIRKQTHQKAMAYVAKIRLDPQLTVYQPEFIKNYPIQLGGGNHKLDGDNVNYTNYYLNYQIPGKPHSIVIKGSIRDPKLAPEAVCPLAHGLNTDPATQRLCSLVLVTPSGQKVYGYRSLSSITQFGHDIATIPQKTLQTIQPETFYISLSDTLVTVSFDGQNPNPANPLTPEFTGKLVDSLRPLNASERLAFTERHLKPEKHPYIEIRESLEAARAAESNIGAAIYIALLLWALQRLFAKAGRPQWAAYVPIYNLWLIATIAGRPGWWSLSILLFYLLGSIKIIQLNFFQIFPFSSQILLLFGLPMIVAFSLISFSLARRFAKHPMFSLLILLPPFIGYFILGFGKSQYHPKSGPSAGQWRILELKEKPGPSV